MMEFFDLQLLHMPDNVERTLSSMSILIILFPAHFCRSFDEMTPRFLDFSRVNILITWFSLVSQHSHF